MNEPWLHSIDLELWKGERTPNDANHEEYDRQKIIDFVYYFTSEMGEMPDVQDILHCLGLSSRYTDDVRITLTNYVHEEEMEERANERITDTI